MVMLGAVALLPKLTKAYLNDASIPEFFNDRSVGVRKRSPQEVSVSVLGRCL